MYVNNKDKSMWIYIPGSDISYHCKNNEILTFIKSIYMNNKDKLMCTYIVDSNMTSWACLWLKTKNHHYLMMHVTQWHDHSITCGNWPALTWQVEHKDSLLSWSCAKIDTHCWHEYYFSMWVTHSVKDGIYYV